MKKKNQKKNIDKAFRIMRFGNSLHPWASTKNFNVD